MTEQKKNVPKLRFPEFKNAPAWEQRKLYELGNYYPTKSLSYDDLEDGGKYKCLLYGELFTTFNEIILRIIFDVAFFSKK